MVHRPPLLHCRREVHQQRAGPTVHERARASRPCRRPRRLQCRRCKSGCSCFFSSFYRSLAHSRHRTARHRSGSGRVPGNSSARSLARLLGPRDSNAVGPSQRFRQFGAARRALQAGAAPQARSTFLVLPRAPVLLLVSRASHDALSLQQHEHRCQQQEQQQRHRHRQHGKTRQVQACKVDVEAIGLQPKGDQGEGEGEKGRG